MLASEDGNCTYIWINSVSEIYWQYMFHKKWVKSSFSTASLLTISNRHANAEISNASPCLKVRLAGKGRGGENCDCLKEGVQTYWMAPSIISSLNSLSALLYSIWLLTPVSIKSTHVKRQTPLGLPKNKRLEVSFEIFDSVKVIFWGIGATTYFIYIWNLCANKSLFLLNA